jgi:beta-1,4-mannosyltransferase
VRPPIVVFQVTAIGTSPKAIEESVRSILYWTRHTARLAFRCLVWMVIEPRGHATAPELYSVLTEAGVRVLVVPPSYRTPHHALGKARALEYASDRRRQEGLSVPGVWIYHQDEETCVGQDTLLGLSEFVLEDLFGVGTGVILYPIDWAGTPSHVQELVRSYDDFRVLDSMTEPGNPTIGFHGSHFVIRADIEDVVGWDLPGYSPAEDLLFETRVRARFGAVFGVLRGFAYEKGAFSLRAQLRQRRRWVHGVLHVLRRSPGLSARRRVTVAYSALSWFSALPSLILLVASAAVHYGPLLEVTGCFTGFVWVSMALPYVEGFRLHAPYVHRSPSRVRLALNAVVGALVDAVAPWYALVTRPSMNDFIRKDLPVAD